MPFLETDLRAALHDATAAAILQSCIRQGRSAKDISAHIGAPPVTVYRHIHRLCEQRLLMIERSALTSSGKPYDIYRATFEWATLSLREDAIHTQWEATGRARDRLHELWKRLENRK